MLFLTKFEKEKLIFKRILPALNCNRFQSGENAVQIAKKQVKNFASDAIINSRNMWYYQLEKGVPIFYTGTQILLPRVSERIDIMPDMKTSKIKLNEASEVEEFVKAAGKCDFDIDIFYNRVIIDAKSILGIMSMDLTQELTVQCYGEDKEFDKAIQKFAIA